VPALRLLTTDELRPERLARLRELLDLAWSDEPEGFTEEDWGHAVGGLHVVVEEAGAFVSHASIVERELHTGGDRVRTGYVEAVATRPDRRRRGHGAAVMRAAGDHIDRAYRLGALATGIPAFYERLGWIVWEGPTFVRTDAGLLRTPEEDGSVLVRPTPTSPDLDRSAPISCEWRPGDVW
jgi:aminoglycoside 2'-N-acetyltransferase I